MSNETNETPSQGRKVGIARFFELLGRDLWPLYKSGILCVLGFLPGPALAVFGMMAGSALLTVVGGVVGGLVGGPFLSGMIDTVLRALRDEPGYWWNTYKRAWKQNWRQSLVPGALLGLFVGSWAWMLRAQAESGNTSTALWVASIAGISDEGELTGSLAGKEFPVVSDARGEEMREAIAAAREAGDSVGGVIECAIFGAPAGLGDPMFGGMENRIASAVFGIPAVKGVEFGAGFGVASLRGSEDNDAFTVENGKIITETNHCGGILGGITNGMPIVFRAAFKPTPSIAREQQSVNLQTMTPEKMAVTGRHDPCIVPRAVPCVEAAAAIAVYDAYLSRKREMR